MLTLDRKRAKAPVRASRAERLYTKQLSGLARQVGAIIGEFPPGDIETLPTLEQMLRRYAEALMPWATVAASKMIEEVNARDLAGWKAVSAEMSHEIRREILTAPTGKAMRALSMNVEAARLMGIRTSRVISMTFVIGSTLAAVGAVLGAFVPIPGAPLVVGFLGAIALGVLGSREEFIREWSGTIVRGLVGDDHVSVHDPGALGTYLREHHVDHAAFGLLPDGRLSVELHLRQTTSLVVDL